MDSLTFYIILFSPFWITGIVAMIISIRNLAIKKIAITHGSKQRLMFNQLKKGNFVWRINNNNKIESLCVKRVIYNFDSKGNIASCILRFYGNNFDLIFDSWYKKTLLLA